MNFRSIADLNNCLVAGLAKVPRDIDLIVGIPRSGMLPATILALYLNTALTDVDGLLTGKLMQTGISREIFQRVRDLSEVRKILVIDDSCNLGKQLQSVRDKITAAGIQAQVIFAAAYVTPEACGYVDLYFDICPMPRMFEWNLMHHGELQSACLDIDGVLCLDPTDEENDDGEKYLRFLREAVPLWIPSVPVGCLVTSRLEKYRFETKQWLERQRVKYDELIMLNMASADERRKSGCHGKFKGEIYRSKYSQLFIESDPKQAQEIALLAAKPVFCIADNRVYLPSSNAVMKDLIRRTPSIGWRLLTRARKWLN